ncbi:MAG: PIG-L family deacetylase, partial [Flavitalea sp.]
AARRTKGGSPSDRERDAGQIDGDTIVNGEWLKKLQQLVAEEKPDIVFTHWPVDTHKDHQAASLLTMQVWTRTEKKFALYFFEVCAGFQTMVFHPTDFVDITETRELKNKSVYCHTSQNPANIYGADGHTAMEEFRGMQMGVKAAEAFVCMKGKLSGMMEID